MSGCAKRRLSVSLSDLRLASDQESRNNLLDDLFDLGLKEVELGSLVFVMMDTKRGKIREDVGKLEKLGKIGI